MILHDYQKKVSFRAVGANEFLDRIRCLTDNDLRILEAPHNALSSIEFVARFSNLSQLLIPDNNVTSLIGIQVLWSLRILDLSGNQVQRFEELKTLTKLEKLDLSYNSIEIFQDLHLLKHGCRGLRELRIQGNPGSTARDTNFHLFGFGSLSILLIGLTSSSSRLSLIWGIPSLEMLDETPISTAERHSAHLVDPSELYRTAKVDEPPSILPVLSCIQEVSDATARLESELAESQRIMEVLRKDKEDYTEYVSANVKKLMNHITKLTNERDSERMRFHSKQNELDRQVQAVSSDLVIMRESIDTSLRNAVKNEERFALTATRFDKMEEAIDARIVHGKIFDSKLDTLLTLPRSFTQNLRLGNRVNLFLKQAVDELLTLSTASIRERKILTGHLTQVRATLDCVKECVSFSTGAICALKESSSLSLRKLTASLQESESARESLTKQIESMRSECMQSIAIVDQLTEKKLAKHEQAIAKLHLLYESEWKAKDAALCNLEEAVNREKGLTELIDRLAAENRMNEKNVRIQNEQNMNVIIMESELRTESLQRKCDIREKDILDLNETLDKMRTSSKVKDEVIADLSSQLRDMKEQIAILGQEKDVKDNERIEAMKLELRSSVRDTEQIKRQLEETEMALHQKDQLVQYVSAEINGIKESYEAKLTSLTESHTVEMTKMKQKLAEAVAAIKHLDNEVNENRKQNEKLQVALEAALSEKIRFEKLNSQKISQIKCILGDSLS